MKKIVLLISVLGFIIFTAFFHPLSAQENEYFYCENSKKTQLYDELFNGEENKVHEFHFSLDHTYNVYTEYYCDGELVQPRKYCFSLRDSHLMYIGIFEGSLTFSSEEYGVGTLGITPSYSIEIFRNALENITHIRTDQGALNEDTITLLQGEYQEDGHLYVFKLVTVKQ